MFACTVLVEGQEVLGCRAKINVPIRAKAERQSKSGALSTMRRLDFKSKEQVVQHNTAQSERG